MSEPLGEAAQAAWDRAWEVAKEKHPGGITPVRIPLHNDKVWEYRLEKYTLEWVGPNWWNITCNCLASQFGVTICHHRAVVAHFRLTEEEEVVIEEAPCPWCNIPVARPRPSGYHIGCEFDILSADAADLRANSRLDYHAARLRGFYVNEGLTIPVHPGKRTALDDLFE